VLVEAARRLDPPRLRRAVAHLRLIADPDAATSQADRQHQQRGLWLAATFEGMVAVDGLLEPEAGQTLLSALEPLARPTDADDDRSGGQRRADALHELARRALKGGQLPETGGVRPQLTVTVDLDSPVGHLGAVGGEVGWVGPLDPEACRRLACDGAVTRVLVTRHPTSHHPREAHHLRHQLQRRRFTGLVEGAFRHPGRPLQRGLVPPLTDRQLRRLARDLGFPLGARPADLEAAQWARLHAFLTHGADLGTPGRSP
jgi:hypothetical protein